MAKRNSSDSIVVKVTSDTGISGFGEGVPRSYVTGETIETSVEHIRRFLLPALLGLDLDTIEKNDFIQILPSVEAILPRKNRVGKVVWNASRCAVGLAITDCLLRAQNLSLAALLPPIRKEVIYSGVITSGHISKTEKIAQRLKEAQFRHVKVKVETQQDVQRVGLVRDILGPGVSMRLDANGAFDKDEAARFLAAVAKYDIDCMEQPLARGATEDFAALRASTPVPLMADESIVTFQDAEELIANGACDLFNLRLSKCGGLHSTLAIARLAADAGIGIQLGCQVGESAILSAAGRHVAAHIDALHFVEGSYGTHLLVEDIAEEEIKFHGGGIAPVLLGVGFGVSVNEEALEKFAKEIFPVSRG